MKAEISIKLKLKDGKTLTLNYDDGIELFNELKRIYEKEVTKEYVPTIPLFPVQPYDYWRPYYKDYEITCGSSCINA